MHGGGNQTDGSRRWLDEREMRAWRSFIEIVEALLVDLDGDLLVDHGLTRGDYEVFVYLSESPERSMRMCDLAVRLRLSPSGLTRRLDGLVKAGYVARTACAADRRVTWAVLTPEGFQKLQDSAPDHVASVRRHLLDHLTPAEMDGLANAFVAIKAGRASSRDAAA